MTVRLAVLGAGPSGLVTAHIAKNLGYNVEVFSKGARKSDIYGCQYLHAPVPGIHAEIQGPGIEVNYRLDGTSNGYRDKVYGQDYRGTVSPEDLIGKHMAWDLRSTYNALWEHNGRDVHALDVSVPGALAELRRSAEVILSTIPAPMLCEKPDVHKFTWQTVWAMGDAPGIQEVPVQVPEFTVICNGADTPAWYRAANVYGYKTVEWPVHRKPPIPEVTQVRKPLLMSCDCNGDIIRFGRYGAWKKGILVSDVVTAVLEELS